MSLKPATDHHTTGLKGRQPERQMERLIIITDAHVGGDRSGTREFLRMLDRFEGVGGGFVFLGDIFELWIALDRYETEVHRRFLEWCRRQRRHRSLGFMEGNHEFFVARERREAFGWCTDRPSYQQDGILYVHGDQIDRRDVNHLSFRWFTRNRLAAEVLRFAPGGPRLTGRIAALLKASSPRFRTALPTQAIRRFGETCHAAGAHTVLIGHFHQEQCLGSGRSCCLHLLPDWQTSGKITLLDTESRKVTSRHWTEIE
jgi:UDP-2,3-diacylglucosamine pyrophosphatase LpxH